MPSIGGITRNAVLGALKRNYVFNNNNNIINGLCHFFVISPFCGKYASSVLPSTVKTPHFVVGPLISRHFGSEHIYCLHQ